MNASCVVVVPLYKNTLEPLEEFSLDYSLGRLAGREVVFIAPKCLDFSYYHERYPSVRAVLFEDGFFSSIKGYNRLLLNPGFYEVFGQYEHMLILQTDAIVLRDELDLWCETPYDYIGAPWPDALELSISLDVFKGDCAKKVQTQVGNGGLSLRRNKKCIGLIHEFSEAIQMFLETGSSEDIFFSILGSQSLDFLIPNDRVAGLFSLEVRPEFYFSLNGNRPPMGGHAWWKQMPFWMQFIEKTPPVFLAAAPPGKVAFRESV